MMKGLAMRLFHLGLSSNCVGEMTTPSIGSTDLLIASVEPHGFGTANAICRCARESGAKVLLLTAQPARSVSQFAHVVSLIPAQTMVDDQSPTTLVLFFPWEVCMRTLSLCCLRW
eukprot:Gb_00954 [translate_table: standard]